MAFLSQIIQLSQSDFTKLLSNISTTYTINDKSIKYDPNTLYIFDRYIPEWSKGADRAVRSDKSVFSNYSKFADHIKALSFNENGGFTYDSRRETIFYLPFLYQSQANHNYGIYGNQYKLRYSSDFYYDIDADSIYGNFNGNFTGNFFIQIKQNITSKENYPIIWSQTNSSSNSYSYLYKSIDHLLYKPSISLLTNKGPINAYREDLTYNNSLSINTLTSTNGNLQAWNKEGNTILRLISNNNLMVLSVGNTTNERIGIIQVGHNNYATYANTLGNLVLNPFGGNVGIGTKAPTYKIHIVGQGYFTGDLIVDKGTSYGTLGTNALVNGVTVKTNNHAIALGIGTGNINRGIYDQSKAKWMIYTDNTNIISNFGHFLPGANGSQYLGNSSYRWGKLYIGTADTYGSTVKPIYWNNGVPVECSFTINATVNSGTDNRMAFYSNSTTISAATTIYAANNLLSVNSTSVPANSGNFQVIGTSTMQTILAQTTNTYDLGSNTLRWKTTYNVDEYIGTEEGFQCHLYFDNNDMSFNFIFD